MIDVFEKNLKRPFERKVSINKRNNFLFNFLFLNKPLSKIICQNVVNHLLLRKQLIDYLDT